jgi:hypothetical protein
MDNNRFLFSFFFICFLSHTSSVYCAQRPSSQGSATNQPYIINVIPAKSVNHDLEFIEPKFILKVSDDTFLLIDGENSSDVRKFSIQKEKLDAMVHEASQSDKERCYVHIKKQGADFHFKITKDKLTDAIKSEPALRIITQQKKRPTKLTKILPQLEREEPNILQQNPQQEPDQSPINPNEFSLPYTHITKNSTVENLSHEDRMQITRNQQEQLKKESEKLKANKQNDREQLLTQMKQENDNRIKELNLYYQEMYLQKIQDSVVLMPDILPESRVIDKELLSINQKLKTVQPSFEINKKTHADMLYQDHIAQLASWNIQQFNQYNKLLEENGQSPIPYEEFHGKVCSLKIRHHTKDQNTPEFVHFRAMNNYTKEILEEIQSFEKETEELKNLVENYSQDYAKAKVMANGGAIVTDCILEEALYVTALGLVSPITKQRMKETISSAKKENKQLDKIFDQKRIHFDLLSDEALIERKKIETDLARQIQANKKLADKLSKKKKTTEERINDLQAQLKEQGTKYDK